MLLAIYRRCVDGRGIWQSICFDFEHFFMLIFVGDHNFFAGLWQISGFRTWVYFPLNVSVQLLMHGILAPRPSFSRPLLSSTGSLISSAIVFVGLLLDDYRVFPVLWVIAAGIGAWQMEDYRNHLKGVGVNSVKLVRDIVKGVTCIAMFIALALCLCPPLRLKDPTDYSPKFLF